MNRNRPRYDKPRYDKPRYDKPRYDKPRYDKPVTSYGIILFKIENNKPSILMINRKDSLCYIDFLRGKYTLTNINYIRILIDKFSNSEKEKIITLDFDSLWKQMWKIDNIEENKFIRDYTNGKTKFTAISDGVKFKNKIVTLKNLVTSSRTNYDSTEWEFPKGRKEKYESNKDCAIREFAEETTLLRDEYNLFFNIRPLVENYIGENKIKYLHIYYIGEITDSDRRIYLDTDNKHQCLEISDIKWLTYSESLSKIRDYHTTRRNVINTIFDFLNDINKYTII